LVPALDVRYGRGAIGTAIALILRELHATGSLTVVDPETYDEPNVTTYSLGNVTTAANEAPKVNLIREALPGITVDPFIGTARDLIQAIDAGAMRMPTIVLGAVDSIEARYEVAALHADCTFDGSTGGASGTMLSLSEATWNGPCPRCYYPPSQGRGPSVTDLLAERTGLSHERLARGTEELTAEELDDLTGLTSEDRATLEGQVGKGVCGLGKAFGLVGGDHGFNPSAAFVAQQAAALVVGALIRGGTSTRPINVQYDALFGPYEDMTLQRQPRAGCRCQIDLELHRAVKSHRREPRA
jgi:hypothetical protein